MMIISPTAELVQFFQELNETFNVFFSPENWERDEIARAIGCYQEDVIHRVVTIAERGDIVQQFGKLDEMNTTVEIGCSEYLHRSESYAVLHNLNRQEIGEATKLLAILVFHLDTPYLNNSLMEHNGVDFPEQIKTLQFYSLEMLKEFLVEYGLFEEFEVEPTNFSTFYSEMDDNNSFMESYYSEEIDPEVEADDTDWGESFDQGPLGEYSDSEVDEMFQPTIEFAEFGDLDDDDSYGGFQPNRYAKRKTR
jgi:hypothetical protein